MKRIIKSTHFLGAVGPVDINEFIRVTIELDADKTSIEASGKSKFLDSTFSLEEKKIRYFEKFIDKSIRAHHFKFADSGKLSPNNNLEFYSKYILMYAPKPDGTDYITKICIRCRISNHKDPTNYSNSGYKAYKSRTLKQLQKDTPDVQDIKTRRITLKTRGENKTVYTYRDAMNVINKRLDEIAQEFQKKYNN